MRNKFLSIIAIAALAGCSSDEPVNDVAVADPAPVAETTDAYPVDDVAPAADATREFYAAFPGLRFAMPLTVVENRVYTADDGEDRQGFTLEFVEGDAASVMASVSEGFVAAGYTPASGQPTDEAGVLKQNFKKTGQPAPFVAVYPTPGAKPVTPGAVGRIWISWSREAEIPGDNG